MQIIDSHFHWWPREIFEQLCKRSGYPRAERNPPLSANWELTLLRKSRPAFTNPAHGPSISKVCIQKVPAWPKDTPNFEKEFFERGITVGRFNVNYRIERAVIECQVFGVADPELEPVHTMHRSAEFNGIL